MNSLKEKVQQLPESEVESLEALLLENEQCL